MGKQVFDRIKKTLGISILVLFVISMMVAVVGAAPPQEEKGYNGGEMYHKNCHWVCDHWSQQRYCDHGHWAYDKYGKRYWYCDHWSWRWVCSHWSWRCY